MTPRKKVAPHNTVAVATYCRTCIQQKEMLMKLLDDAMRYRADYDQLITEVNLVLTAMNLAQGVLQEALAQSYLVDVLPTAKKQ